MSFPVSSPQTASVFLSTAVSGTLKKVWGFENGSWQSYSPAGSVSNTIPLTRISPNQGYWLLMEGDGAVDLSDTAESSALVVESPGWGLVSFNQTKTFDLENEVLGANSISSNHEKENISRVWSFHNGVWGSYSTAESDNSTMSIQPGYAYWFLTQNTANSTISASTPLRIEVSATALGATQVNDLSVIASPEIVHLDWSDAAGAISYRVDYSTSQEKLLTSPESATSGVSRLLLLDLDADKEYFFRVSSVNFAGASTPSSIVSTIPSLSLSDISFMTAPAINHTQIDSNGRATLNWTQVRYATGYNLYYGLQSSFASTKTRLTLNGKSTQSTSIESLTLGQMYSFQMQAFYKDPDRDRGELSPIINAQGTSPDPDPDPPVLNLNPPHSILSTAYTNKVTFTWTPDSQASYHWIYYSTSPSISLTASPRVASSKHSGEVTNLIRDIKYYFKIQAVNGSSSSALSYVVSNTPSSPITEVPAAVQFVNHLANPYGHIQLSWSSSSTADNYRLYYAPGSTVNSSSAFTNVNGQGYNFSSFQGLMPYTFAVAPVNHIGVGSLSSSLTVTPLGPQQPTNLEVAPGNRLLEVSWEGSTNGYIYYSTTPSFTTSQRYASGGASFIVSNLVNNIPYHIAVSSYNLFGESAMTTSVIAVPASTIPEITPPVPTNVQAVANLDGSIQLSWSPSEGAAYYRVYFSSAATVSSSSDKVVSYGTGLKFTRTTAGVTYYFRVSAVNYTGESQLSSLLQNQSGSSGSLSRLSAVDRYDVANFEWEGESSQTLVRYSESEGNGNLLEFRNLGRIETLATYDLLDWSILENEGELFFVSLETSGSSNFLRSVQWSLSNEGILRNELIELREHSSDFQSVKFSSDGSSACLFSKLDEGVYLYSEYNYSDLSLKCDSRLTNEVNQLCR